MRGRRLLVAVLSLLLFATQAGAADWVTKGGGQTRQSVNSDPVGMMAMVEAWRAEGVGQSATQPIVIGDRIYHLAGAYLWEMRVNPDGTLVKGSLRAIPDRGNMWPEPVNMPSKSLFLVSQSSPTFSPNSRVLYFGTAFGRLWSYHTEQGWFRPVNLDWGCPIVGSPLVIHEGGRDWVVVANRPLYQDEKKDLSRPICNRSHGQVWRVGGMDQPVGEIDARPYEAPTKKSAAEGFGGFITPAPVPGRNDPLGPTFVVGTDGFEGGRARQLILNRSDGYRFTPDWKVDGPAGFAGTIVSDGANSYWVDTAGTLWGATLRSGRKPERWPAQSIPLAPAIGAGRLFTNTEPAVEVRNTQTHLYITLRNWVPAGGSDDQLRVTPTGSDGAVVAVGPDGQVKWYRLFPQTAGPGRRSINTAPLAITSQEILLFGDVQGTLYAQALDSTNRNGGHGAPFLVAEGESVPREWQSLLNEGETPAQGPFNFSQVSGVGVDPAMANGLILVGVNYTNGNGPGGRLVAYHVGPGYDLRWTDSPKPLQLTPGQPTAVTNAVELRLTAQSLGELCGVGLPVHWYLTDQAGTVIRQIGAQTLPATLTPGSAWPIHLDLTVAKGDPTSGQIVGIIDHPGLVAATKADSVSTSVRLARQIAAARQMPTPKGCQGTAAEVKRLPGSDESEGGLANNVLVIPWEARSIVDDPFIAGIDHDSIAMGPDFGAQLQLGYSNNLGKEHVDVTAQAWLAEDPNGEWDGAWAPARVNVTCCDAFPLNFHGIAEGEYYIIAEIRYAGDTNLANNRKAYPITVRHFKSTAPQGTGSGLTGGGD